MQIRRVLTVLLAALPVEIFWTRAFVQFLQVMLPRMRNALYGGPVMPQAPFPAPDCDFSMFWPAGLVARKREFLGLYNPDAFETWRQTLLLPQIPRLDWFYPPPSLLPAVLVSYLSFNIAYFVWIGLFLVLSALVLRWARLGWGVIAAGLLSPAALWSMEMGQYAMLSNALIVAGLLSAARAPKSAGALFGALLLKPQAGVLTPVSLLATGNWCALLAGTAVVAGALAITTLEFGWEVWRAYFQYAPAATHPTLVSGMLGFERGVSVFRMVHSLGGSRSFCLVLQAGAMLGAVLLVWRIWLRPGVSVLDRATLN